jgi:NADPH:quinone reductase-like Zn-dependent oxidoreductase
LEQLSYYFGGYLMKAVVYTKYGSPDVLSLQELEKPVPKDNHVLVQVHAVSANAADWHLLRGKPFMLRLAGYGLLKPKKTILGSDMAGRVEAVGKNVTQFRPGDEVFGDLSGAGLGGYAEYVCADENAIAPKPANLSCEHAAALPMAALTALQGLRDKGKIQAGQKVLINGASGGVGTFAVQLAKVFGAHVTAVCSTGKVALARSLGADHVIDYTQEDFTKNGQHYDLILGANGYQPISAYKRSLSANGIYVMIGGSNAQLFQALLWGSLLSLGGSKKLTSVLQKVSRADLVFLKELVEAGKLQPVIDRTYPLEQTAEAIRYLEAGHAKGKIVVAVQHAD